MGGIQRDEEMERGKMKNRTLLIVLSLVLLSPLVCHGGQWKFAEHRYPYKLNDAMDADRFVKKPGYWEGYKGDELAGYVFLSKEWTQKLVGYSGKHMETLIGMDPDGRITGVKLLFHSEPIVLIGLKDENYQKFMEQYAGRDIRQNLSVGKEVSMDAITGATVTAVVQNAIILESARKVASTTGMMTYSHAAAHKVSAAFTPLGWKELVNSGGIQRVTVTSKDLGVEGKGTYLDLYFGIISPPSIGRNVLGEKLYDETLEGLKKGESALVIFSRGEGSFKGAGFARGGIFDRFNLEQDAHVYVFRDKDYRILTKADAEGAPEIKEGGLFIVRGGNFDPTRDFKFNLMLTYRVGSKKEFKSFSADYRIPDMFLE